MQGRLRFLFHCSYTSQEREAAREKQLSAVEIHLGELISHTLAPPALEQTNWGGMGENRGMSGQITGHEEKTGITEALNAGFLFFPSNSSLHPVPLSSIALGHVEADINSGKCSGIATSVKMLPFFLPVP